MSFLVVVSLVWAFSFGLIGKFLPGLPSAWVGWVRLALSALVFLPFVRRVPWRTGWVCSPAWRGPVRLDVLGVSGSFAI
jgi:drug/metabolite transporter (DMT)-like permease